MIESRWSHLSGLRLHYRASDGVPSAVLRPVILIHGLGVSGRYLLPTAIRLSSYCQVYVPDLPGFGQSQNPPQALDIAQMADVLAAWMQDLVMAPAIFLGNSLGCQVIIELAVRYPQVVERIILVSPTTDPSARTVWQQVGRILRDALREPLSLILLAASDYIRVRTVTMWRTIQSALQDRIEDKLPRVQSPTLIVRGDGDPIVPRAWAEQVSRLLPNGQFVEIRGAHALNYTAPDDLAKLVIQFAQEPVSIP